MEKLLEVWAKILKNNKEMLEDIESASAYKLSARTDMTKMKIAKVRYQQSENAYQAHLIARDLATWYEDYFIFKNDN